MLCYTCYHKTITKLFTNLKGVIECFITLIYSFKPDVDPEILNKLQLLKDNEEKYVKFNLT